MASGGHSSSWCAGLSPLRPLLLRSTGSRHADSAIVAHGPSHSAACGILRDQGSYPCPLPRQADSQPLCHQGSPRVACFFNIELHELLIYFGDYPLSIDSLANIFSHSERSLFVLFVISFALQKLLSFIRSHLFIFVFISITLGGGSKKNLL